MKEFRFNEILKTENGEYIMRLSTCGKRFELFVHGMNVEITAENGLCAGEAAALLYALPYIGEAAALVISGALHDLPEDAALSAAEKNWSVIMEGDNSG